MIRPARIEIREVELEDILAMREEYRREMNCQIVHDSYEGDRVFAHTREPVGEWALDRRGEIVATGGFALHYNAPYADLYMDVAEPYRGHGLGRYLVQELKRACHEAGRVPAARCHQANAASRATLVAAGMVPCARIVRVRLPA